MGSSRFHATAHKDLHHLTILVDMSNGMTTKRKRRMNLMITMITVQGRQDDDVRNRWNIKHVRLGKIVIYAWRIAWEETFYPSTDIDCHDQIMDGEGVRINGAMTDGTTEASDSNNGTSATTTTTNVVSTRSKEREVHLIDVATFLSWMHYFVLFRTHRLLLLLEVGCPHLCWLPWHHLVSLLVATVTIQWEKSCNVGLPGGQA